MQERIQRECNINIVTCGHCGNVMLHKIEDTNLLCECGFESEPSDFPDLYYSGLENNYSDELIKDKTYLGQIEINHNDGIKVYSTKNGYTLEFYVGGRLIDECDCLDDDHVWRELKAREYLKSVRKVILEML